VIDEDTWFWRMPIDDLISYILLSYDPPSLYSIQVMCERLSVEELEQLDLRDFSEDGQYFIRDKIRESFAL